jgi:hypothetical protein
MALNPGRHHSLDKVGKNTKQARRLIEIRDPGPLPTAPPPFVNEPKPIEHAVKFYEGRSAWSSYPPMVRPLLDRRSSFSTRGRDPLALDFMRLRYRTWTENLAFDWAISRSATSYPSVWYA